MHTQQQTDDYFKSVILNQNSHLYRDNMSDKDQVRAIKFNLGLLDCELKGKDNGHAPDNK